MAIKRVRLLSCGVKGHIQQPGPLLSNQLSLSTNNFPYPTTTPLSNNQFPLPTSTSHVQQLHNHFPWSTTTSHVLQPICLSELTVMYQCVHAFRLVCERHIHSDKPVVVLLATSGCQKT